MKLEIGQIIDFDFAPGSVIVGRDDYTLYGFNGQRKDWVSYTLESPLGGDYARWWLSAEAAGLFCWVACDTEAPRGELVMAESGLCVLRAIGDSTVETPYSAILFYQAGEEFFSIESFEGTTGVMKMRGRKIFMPRSF